MKKLLLLTSLLIALIACKDENDPQPVSGTLVDMGSGYANDVFVNLETGVVSQVSRTNWQIAFVTSAQPNGGRSGEGACILTNGGAGVNLYPINYDNTQWAYVPDNVGIEGISSLYNSDTSWYFGAFTHNMRFFDDPMSWDFGWGIYSNATHNVDGDSLFVIQVNDTAYKLLDIVGRLANLNNSFVIKHKAITVDATSGASKSAYMADALSSDNSVTDTIPCSDYLDKNFIYYDLLTAELVDREPVKAAWDLVFTKYITKIPQGAAMVDYPVMGVLTNDGISVAEVSGNPAAIDVSSLSFSRSISAIGSDWKVWDGEVYNLADKTFVLKKGANYFTLRFESFDNALGQVSVKISKI